MKSIFVVAALLLAAASFATHAQHVYRCGSSYGQVPCEGGSAVKVDDSRSAAQSAATTAETIRQGKSAEAMEKARLRDEAKAAPASVMQTTKSETLAAPAPREKEIQPSAHAKKHGKKPDYFTAVAPKKAQDKKPGKKKPAKKSA